MRGAIALESGPEERRSRSRAEPFLAIARHGGQALAVRSGTVAAETVGLLAGSGRFPILFAEAARRQGLQVACVGIKYEASDELRALCASFDVVGRRQAGRDDPHLPPPRRPADRHGGQGHQERDLHALADGPALPGLPDRCMVVPAKLAPTTATTRSCSP